MIERICLNCHKPIKPLAKVRSKYHCLCGGKHEATKRINQESVQGKPAPNGVLEKQSRPLMGKGSPTELPEDSEEIF